MQTKLFRRDFTLVVIGQIISLFGNARAGDRRRNVYSLGYLSDFAFECGVFYFFRHHGNLYPHPA